MLGVRTPGASVDRHRPAVLRRVRGAAVRAPPTATRTSAPRCVSAARSSGCSRTTAHRRARRRQGRWSTRGSPATRDPTRPTSELLPTASRFRPLFRRLFARHISPRRSRWRLMSGGGARPVHQGRKSTAARVAARRHRRRRLGRADGGHVGARSTAAGDTPRWPRRSTPASTGSLDRLAAEPAAADVARRVRTRSSATSARGARTSGTSGPTRGSSVRSSRSPRSTACATPTPTTSPAPSVRRLAAERAASPSRHRAGAQRHRPLAVRQGAARRRSLFSQAPRALEDHRDPRHPHGPPGPSRARAGAPRDGAVRPTPGSRACSPSTSSTRYLADPPAFADRARRAPRRCTTGSPALDPAVRLRRRRSPTIDTWTARGHVHARRRPSATCCAGIAGCPGVATGPGPRRARPVRSRRARARRRARRADHRPVVDAAVRRRRGRGGRRRRPDEPRRDRQPRARHPVRRVGHRRHTCIPDGALVEVDGNTGTVTVLEVP